MFLRWLWEPAASLQGYGRYVFPLCCIPPAYVDQMFILPLLHSSFAARKAITEQQLNNMSSFVQRLKALRSSSLYPPEVQAVNPAATEEKQGTITDIPAPTSLSLISPLSALPTALRVLTEAMQATDTTRTSLMTSLSSYTNELHTQSLGMKVGGHGSSGFGLNAALAKEGAAGGRGVEWDEARKEVRLIKGLLLNRYVYRSRCLLISGGRSHK
jgi:hypothetical protein